MTSTIVLITGANRGIGKGILELYLKKPNHFVIAANRDPSHPTSNALADLPKAEGTTLEIIKIDALFPTDPTAAVNALTAKGITHIDILVANAGIALSWPKVSDVKVEDIQKHIDVNVYGFVHLYQAFRSLLKEAQAPKNFIPMQNAAYAPTKAIQHWYTKAISIEDSWLNAFPVDPGWVQTDLGNRGADAFGFEKAAVTVEDSAAGVVKVIDASTLQTHSGKLFKFDGNEEPW
ncbi:Short-chain dehydrogenase/reductase SDR [Penicillium concentricum]|uniref:Short-chain dehydrogenase/reductase SDR n=1 Tax=Penicillium concentricum TaxID=293559 RepID=A0A9W9S466_9EURO|nr:Short-chain dehydrogenase/reductase SDR [Penicillium concentricum]KAJ5371706.1 Short-chain dehydrogenase/reductase SDR [Penicillium concentricum]